MAGSGIFFSVIPASAHAQLSKGRTVMAYVHITTSKGRGIEDFRTVSAKHSPPQAIDGLLAWAAGSDEDGLHAVTVWQSRAHQEPWAAAQLFPSFHELGMTGGPVDSEFTAY